MSTAVIGGITAIIFLRFGLLFWAGLLGWASLAGAGDEPSALKQTIAASLFGAVLAWLGITAALMFPVPAEGWPWVLRAALALTVTLYLLEAGTTVSLFSKRSAALIGYASLLGASALLARDRAGLQWLTGPHLDNPGVAVPVALVVGALVGQVAKTMARALSKE